MYFKNTYALFIIALLAILIIIPGCEFFSGTIPEAKPEVEPAETDPEEPVDAVEPVDDIEPFTTGELGLENLGLGLGMSLEEVIIIMGEPLETEDHDVMGPQATIFYDGISLGFDQGLYYFDLTTPEITGPRGISVGDPVEKVLNSYPLLNEIPGNWENPDATFDPEINDRCVELYYFEPDDNDMVKSGISYCHEDTGDISKIVYSHYAPFTCFNTGTTYYIENGLVTKISRSGF